AGVRQRKAVVLRRQGETSAHFPGCLLSLVCLLSVSVVVPSAFCFVSEVAEDSVLAAPRSSVFVGLSAFIFDLDCCSVVCVLLSCANAGTASPTSPSKESVHALRFMIPPLVNELRGRIWERPGPSASCRLQIEQSGRPACG